MHQEPEKYIEELLYQTDRLSVVETINLLSTWHQGKVTFSSSFSMEDQVITDMILSNRIPVTIFTLDTGRLFPETYSVWSSTNDHYQTRIKPFYPAAVPLENFVEENGPNAFYTSVELRKECCFLRKVEPLRRALAGNEIWITGLRAEHSPNRQDVGIFEYDGSNRIIKYNPILHWTTGDVRTYINDHNVPYNSLHDRGFVSIGCAPCTRAIREGEDFRAGRWWWEEASKKECGLHVHN